MPPDLYSHEGWVKIAHLRRQVSLDEIGEALARDWVEQQREELHVPASTELRVDVRLLWDHHLGTDGICKVAAVTINVTLLVQTDAPPEK